MLATLKRMIIEMQYARLYVLETFKIKGDKSYKNYCVCLCDCGKITISAECNLKGGQVRSCGCLRSERTKETFTKHGKSYSRAWRAWSNMRRRCYDKKTNRYHLYGARGIRVCSRWRKSFSAFYADMGDPPKGYSLDRINVNGNYTPSNCRWATAKQQARNTRTNRTLRFNGQEKLMLEWCRIKRIKYQTVYCRLQRGWSVRDALTIPVQDWGR